MQGEDCQHYVVLEVIQSPNIVSKTGLAMPRITCELAESFLNLNE